MSIQGILRSSGISVKTTESAVDGRQDLKEAVTNFEPEPPKLIVRRGDKIEAVRACVVPEAYIDCDFDVDRIKENQSQQAKISKRRFMVRGFDKYCAITQGIISTVIANKVPNQSYLIGAPNGFGKTSFVNTCLIKLFSQGKLCAPYVSLSELAQVKRSHEENLLQGITSDSKYKVKETREVSIEEYMDELYEQFNSKIYTKKPIIITDKFSWSEYMNCDLLFCYFTDVSSKVLESEMLKAILNIRGVKGLPTIAMISTSLNPYKNDKYLAEFVWNEILTNDDASACFDRVKHISCYKDYNAVLESR